MAPVLGYWKIRGLAQPIRLLLHYVGAEYEDKLYVQGDGPEFSRQEWYSVKETLGLDFPNLPYYIDGDVKLTQSMAITFYLGAKYNLNGKDASERAAVGMLQCEMMDFRTSFGRISYAIGESDAKYEELKAAFINNLPYKLQQFSNYLKDKPYLVGNDITTVDFNLYDFLDSLKYFQSDCLDKFPNLKEYVSRIEALPAVKSYMSSPDFIAWPLNNKVARFGGGERP